MRKRNADDSGHKAWALFLTAHAALTERVEAALVEAGLPPLAWYDVLWELEKAEDNRLRLHELAQRIVISRSNLTRLLDRLETAGLISREPCPDDRRGAYAVLTAAGGAMRKKVWPVYGAQIEASFAGHLSDAEGRQLISIFKKLLSALGGAAS